jgi:hypothetical protein
MKFRDMTHDEMLNQLRICKRELADANAARVKAEQERDTLRLCGESVSRMAAELKAERDQAREWARIWKAAAKKHRSLMIEAPAETPAEVPMSGNQKTEPEVKYVPVTSISQLRHGARVTVEVWYYGGPNGWIPLTGVLKLVRTAGVMTPAGWVVEGLLSSGQRITWVLVDSMEVVAGLEFRREHRSLMIEAPAEVPEGVPPDPSPEERIRSLNRELEMCRATVAGLEDLNRTLTGKCGRDKRLLAEAQRSFEDCLARLGVADKRVVELEKALDEVKERLAEREKEIASLNSSLDKLNNEKRALTLCNESLGTHSNQIYDSLQREKSSHEALQKSSRDAVEQFRGRSFAPRSRSSVLRLGPRRKHRR